MPPEILKALGEVSPVVGVLLVAWFALNKFGKVFSETIWPFFCAQVEKFQERSDTTASSVVETMTFISERERQTVQVLGAIEVRLTSIDREVHDLNRKMERLGNGK